MTIIKRLKGLTRLTPAQKMEMWGVLCMACFALGMGYIAAFVLKAPWLYVVSLIPAALSMAAAHFHDWSREI